MPGVEDRILGHEPHKKAGGKFDSTKVKFVLENEEDEPITHFPRVLWQSPSVRTDPFTGTLFLQSYHFKPNEPDIAYERWSRHTSLESVTGACAEIVGEYDNGGEVAEKTQELYTHVRERLKEFGDHAITDVQLERMRRESEEKLLELGFSTARKPHKVAVAKQVGAGVDFDSLNRRNPLISRARLASSLMKVLLEQRFEHEVLNKYFHLFFLLLGEQQLEEAYVQTILDEFSSGNFRPEILKEEPNKYVIKASPYHLPVMQAYAAVFGVPPHRRAEFERYFENDEDLAETLNNPNTPIEVRHAIITANLQTAIADGASIYLPSV